MVLEQMQLLVVSGLLTRSKGQGLGLLGLRIWMGIHFFPPVSLAGGFSCFC